MERLLKVVLSMAALCMLASCGGMGAAPDAHVSCPADQSQLFKTEDAHLGAATFQDAQGTFFVRLFGGLWIMPDRYSVDGMGYGTISMQSPADFRHPSSECAKNLIGYVRFGDYGEYKQHYSESYRDPYTKLTSTEQNGRFTIIVYTSTFPDRTMLDVLIHDDKQFISIVDDNPQLWKVMLEAFKRLNPTADETKDESLVHEKG